MDNIENILLGVFIAVVINIAADIVLFIKTKKDNDKLNLRYEILMEKIDIENFKADKLYPVISDEILSNAENISKKSNSETDETLVLK